MNKVFWGDCIEVLPTLEENSLEACVTDPPYGLRFMGKDWDHGVPGVHFWREVLRVLKPGAHLLAFGGARTCHRLVCAIEDAGFDIRDQIGWAYGSGFPKSLDVSKAIDKTAGKTGEHIPVGGPVRRIRPGADQGKDGHWEKLTDRTYQPHEYQPSTDTAKQWSGFGTALKPALEPICLARKPLDGTVAQNVLKWGTGALNIDGCRVEWAGTEDAKAAAAAAASFGLRAKSEFFGADAEKDDRSSYVNGIEDRAGRWPANLIHDGSEEVLGCFPHVESGQPCGIKAGGQKNCFGVFAGGIPVTGFGDSGSAARFFYTAKANQMERKGSKHPTVKPLDLMRYLVRLITPPGGVVLDPFAGTGTTGQAALMEGMKYLLIEREEQYIKDIKARMLETQIGMAL